MKVLVCGSRGWHDYKAVEHTLRQLLVLTKDQAEPPTIIHGGASGADSYAGRAAHKLGLKVDVYPADWKRLGKRAGIVRNLEMLDMLDPNTDIVISFWDGHSKGTKHTTDEAKRREIPVEVIVP